MNEALQVLLTDGVIDEVVGRLKSGKEADVYLVRHGGEVVAAKIYKEREHRNFRNNSGYREGRQVRNTRTARAIAKGSRFGVAAAEDAWKTAEVEALFKLHAAGVCVPRPVMFYEGVLLMELVLDLEGHPAPRLEEAQLTAEEASALYFDLRNQAIRMLCCDLIHGDLSAFNILLGNRGATIIDLPQVVDAAANSQAEFFFKRDVENLRRYFEAVDPSLRARSGDAFEIWRAYVRRELTPDYEPTGRFQGEDSRDRRFSGGPRNGDNRGGGPRGNGGSFSGNRPPGNRPQGERPPGNRPPGERPPGNRLQGERPAGNRPPGERPARRDGEGSRPWREPRDARSGPPPQQPSAPPPRQAAPPAPATEASTGAGPQREQRPPREARQGFRDQRPPRGDRPPRGGGDARRQGAENAPRSSPPGPQGPRGRPPVERHAPGRGDSGPQVSYVQKNVSASPPSSKPDDES
jgi:RIO kinase 1